MNRVRLFFQDRLTHFLGTVHEPWYTILNGFANRLILLRHPERITHPGTFCPEKTFYLIRDTPSTAGLASWYDRVLGYMIRAERKGWIPVVEPQQPALPDDGDWYAFFKGPSDISPVDACKGRNVVFATTHGVIHKRYSKRNIAVRHRLCEKIPFSDAAREYADARLPSIFADAPKPMVGVVFRGTDYRAVGNYRPRGHAKVPTYETFCEVISADLKRWRIDDREGEHVFVVTEEQEALEAILRRFPKCRFVEKERFADFDIVGGGMSDRRLKSVTRKENNFLYLLDILALAKCDYLIGWNVGAVLMALNLNGNRYRDVHMLKTGVN